MKPVSTTRPRPGDLPAQFLKKRGLPHGAAAVFRAPHQDQHGQGQGLQTRSMAASRICTPLASRSFPANTTVGSSVSW